MLSGIENVTQQQQQQQQQSECTNMTVDMFQMCMLSLFLLRKCLRSP